MHKIKARNREFLRITVLALAADARKTLRDAGNGVSSGKLSSLLSGYLSPWEA